MSILGKRRNLDLTGDRCRERWFPYNPRAITFIGSFHFWSSMPWSAIRFSWVVMNTIVGLRRPTEGLFGYQHRYYCYVNPCADILSVCEPKIKLFHEDHKDAAEGSFKTVTTSLQ